MSHQPSPDDIDARLDKALLREHLTGPDRSKPREDTTDLSGLGYGMRLAMEFLGGTLVGMGIGYGIDRYFDSMPWGMAIFTLLGFGAGTLNMYRLVNQMDDTIGTNRAAVVPPLKPAADLTKPPQTGTSDP